MPITNVAFLIAQLPTTLCGNLIQARGRGLQPVAGHITTTVRPAPTLLSARWVAVVMAKPKRLSPWTFRYPREQKPKLERLQKHDIEASIDGEISKAIFGKIKDARRTFFRSLLNARQVPEYEQLLRRLKSARNALSNLISTLTDGRLRTGPTYNAPFDRIGIILASRLMNGDFSLCSVPTLIEMESRAYALVEEVKPLPQSDGLQHQNVWNIFIDRLASAFEESGGIATAAKSSQARNPRPSAFVQFVRDILKTLPDEFQIYMHSPGATAKAVSSALAARRSSQKTAGPISSRT
jgi:hypothetical protein